MARDFRLAGAVATDRAYPAVSYSVLPLAVSPGGPHDALNPANYTIQGPGSIRVVSVQEDLEDLARFILLLDAPLPKGTWTVTAGDVRTSFGETLSERAVSFEMGSRVAVVGQRPVPAGYTSIRQALNSALTGGGWEPLCKALGWSAQKTSNYARFVIDQLFLHTATSSGLTKRSIELTGAGRPQLLGLADEPFRRMAELLCGPRSTLPTFIALADVFYGPLGTRAVAVSGAVEPFALSGGEDLRMQLDVTPFSVIFAAGDLESPGNASAASVAAALSFYADRRGLGFYADTYTDSAGVHVRLVSRTMGLGARMRFLGGSAQRRLRMPSEVAVYVGTDPLPSWTIARVPASGTITLTTTITPCRLDASLIHPGDLACIYGTEFSVANRGTFRVVNVSVTLAAGVRTQVLELDNPTGATQSLFAQVTENSLVFLRPDFVLAPPSGPIITAAPVSRLLAELPISSQVVVRDPATAAYVRDWVLAEVTGAQRRNGFLYVTAPSHGLSIGDQAEIRRPTPLVDRPATIAGSSGVADASLASIWSQVDAMSVARAEHVVIELSSGSVLVAGGYDGAAAIDDCERFQVTGSTTLAGGEEQLSYEWATTASMPYAASRHRATQLGRYAGFAVVTGGYDGTNALDDAALYEEAADTWTSLPTMADARYWHGQATSPEKVTVCGGFDGTNPLDSTEYMLATTLAWTSGPSMVVGRYKHGLTATSGVLVASGGIIAGGQPTERCEVFDETGLTWTEVGRMTWARHSHFTTALPDGRVLVVGGQGRLAGRPTDPVVALSSCEVFDPVRGCWEPWDSVPYAVGDVAGAMTYPNLLLAQGTAARTYSRDVNNAAWIPGPKVGFSPTGPRGAGSSWFLACGGTVSGTPTTAAYLYVPASNTFAGRGPVEFSPVWDVPDANTIVFQEPGPPTYWESLEVRSGTEEGNWTGPYIFSPTEGFAVGGLEGTAITQIVESGLRYTFVDVSTAPQPTPEWCVFDLGGALETGPVKVLGRSSATRLRIDGNYTFPKTLPAGTRLDWLFQKGPYDPPYVPGAAFNTGSDKAPVYLRDLMRRNVAAGQESSVELRYPGDRGLAGEGLPTSGEGKLSELPEIWSGE